jgi:hypothetical protein
MKRKEIKPRHFFLDNHPEYIEKVIKSIVKTKYRDMTKKKNRKKKHT